MSRSFRLRAPVGSVRHHRRLGADGNDNLAGSGVTLYFTCGTQSSPRACNAPGKRAALLAHGNGLIKLTAPTTGTYAGLALAYDRLNTSPLWLTGNGDLEVRRHDLRLLREDAVRRQRLHQDQRLADCGELAGVQRQQCVPEVELHQGTNVYVPPDGLHLSK